MSVLLVQDTSFHEARSCSLAAGVHHRRQLPPLASSFRVQHAETGCRWETGNPRLDRCARSILRACVRALRTLRGRLHRP